MGIRKLIIEGESQIIVNTLRKRRTLNWIIDSKLEIVLNIIDKFEETRFLHIYQEGNKIENHLAKRGVDGEDITILASNTYFIHPTLS